MVTWTALARTSDPETSHMAAASVGDLRLSQAAVHAVLDGYGPMTDEDLVAVYQAQHKRLEYPAQSPSGIRSRRAELVRLGLAFDTGVREPMTTGRMARIWAAAQ